MDDLTEKLGDPDRPLPRRPIRAAVGYLNRSPKPESAAAPPSAPKSGLSYNIRHYTRNPMEQWPAGQNLTEEQEAEKTLHDEYIKAKLWGFTINHLQDAGSWDDPNATPSDLHRLGCIHPVYGYEMWETGQTCEDIGHGFPGKWDVRGNDAVREALKPSLYLASLLLTHSATWTWFDALLFSPRKEITPADPKDTKDGCKPSKIMYRTFEFRPRDPVSVQHSRETFETYAASLRAKIRLCIKSAVLRAEKEGNYKLVYGWHRPSYRMIESGGIFSETYSGVTHISSEMVLPLLRSDLTVSERLIQQFCVAKTMVHETMHSFGKYMQEKFPHVETRGAEPFFQDEEICELGRSWENACFGGLIDHLHRRNKTNFTEPSLGLVVFPWPNWYNFGTGQVTKPVLSRYRYHENFPDGTLAYFWVMPMFFIQNIQQMSFWEAQVPKYGVDALKSERIIGSRLTKGQQQAQMIWGPDGRPDRVAKRVFPKRDAVPTADRLSDFMTATIAERYSAVADDINMALRQQQIYTNLAAGEPMDVDQDELDQQSKILTEVLKEGKYSPEIHNSRLLNELTASKYPEIRLPASLAVVRNPNINTSRRKRLCSMVQAEAKVMAERDGADEKWNEYVQVATVELEGIRRNKEQKRKREEEGQDSLRAAKHPRLGSESAI